jgi:hypothetical protein
MQRYVSRATGEIISYHTRTNALIAQVLEFLAATGGETQDCSEKLFRGTDVRESHPLPTANVEAHPPCAKGSLVVYPAAGVVPSFASRLRAGVKHEPNKMYHPALMSSEVHLL